VPELKLKRWMTEEEDLALRKPLPLDGEISHYDEKNFVRPKDGEVKALKEDGSILFWLIPNVYDQNILTKAYKHLKMVKGDCGTRPEVVGARRELRKRVDGSVEKQLRTPTEIVKKYRKAGCRADYLGYEDKHAGRRYCRQTAWTAKNPEVLRGCEKLVRLADKIFANYVPDRHAKQLDQFINQTDFQLWDTAFSTMTVNRKLSTTYHRDENDYIPGLGVMLTLGEFTGGQLIFPAFRAAIDYQPGSVILADVHETHGNAKNIVGDRITCVLYAREKIGKCGTVEDEDEIVGMAISGRED
jgi:hypothetical protein